MIQALPEGIVETSTDYSDARYGIRSFLSETTTCHIMEVTAY
jgi:hypothetical protein